MKKRFILGAAALGTASFMMLSGFDSAETAESVLAKYQEASAALTDTNAQVEMAADLALEIPDADTTFDVQGQGSMEVAVALDPLAAAVSGSFTGSAVGMDGSLSMGTYMVTEEDGSITVYSGTDEEWTKTTLDSEIADQLRQAIELSNTMDASEDYPITYTLDSAAADVNGTECYKLTAVLTWDDIKEVMNWSLDKVKELGLDEVSTEDEELDLDSAYAELESYLELADPYVSGLQLNIELDIDTESFYPVLLHIDMDGSDWSTLEILTASLMGLTNEDDSLMDVNFNINALYMDYYFDTESAVVIEVPEEVAASAVEVSADDLAEELVDVMDETEG